jgi:hypothetical protein
MGLRWANEWKLSERAEKLMKRAEWPSDLAEYEDESQIRAELAHHEVHEHPVFVEFQRAFGGARYRLPHDMAYLGIWCPLESGRASSPQVVERDGFDSVLCAAFRVAQMAFFLRSDGLVYDPDSPWCSYGSARKMIENHAMMCEVESVAATWRTESVRALPGRPLELSEQGLGLIPEASDELNRWWRGDDVFVVERPFAASIPLRSFMVSAKFEARVAQVMDAIVCNAQVAGDDVF